MKVGKSTKKGCATMVFSIFLCQQEATPRRKPGKNILHRMVANNGRSCSSGVPTYLIFVTDTRTASV